MPIFDKQYSGLLKMKFHLLPIGCFLKKSRFRGRCSQLFFPNAMGHGSLFSKKEISTWKFAYFANLVWHYVGMSKRFDGSGGLRPDLWLGAEPHFGDTGWDQASPWALKKTKKEAAFVALKGSFKRQQIGSRTKEK